MKIQHSVMTEDAEVDVVWSLVSGAIETVFPTVEAQEAAIAAASTELEHFLNHLVLKAFSAGEKIGAYHADTKDGTMYGLK